MDKSRAGKNNSNWKGDKAGIRAKHYRLEVKYGKASKKPCAICGKITADNQWAEKRDPKTGRLNGHYRVLCKSCHSRYDHKEKNFGFLGKGKKINEGSLLYNYLKMMKKRKK